MITMSNVPIFLSLLHIVSLAGCHAPSKTQGTGPFLNDVEDEQTSDTSAPFFTEESAQVSARKKSDRNTLNQSDQSVKFHVKSDMAVERPDKRFRSRGDILSGKENIIKSRCRISRTAGKKAQAAIPPVNRVALPLLRQFGLPE